MTANRALRSSQVVNIEDLRHLAERRLPKSLFDYLDGGAEVELTLTENCRAFRDVTFRTRGAVAVTDCNLKTRVLGHELSFPALLAPMGYSRLMHPGGEVAAVRSAGLAGTERTLPVGLSFCDGSGSIVRRTTPCLERSLNSLAVVFNPAILKGAS